MDRRQYMRPTRFGNADLRRQREKNNIQEKRSIQRSTNFNLRRDLTSVEDEIKTNISENIPPKVMDRKLALQRFKKEREAQKKALQDKKKPPFVVGIPRHGSSPLLRNSNSFIKNKKETNPTTQVRATRVTRATRVVRGNGTKEVKSQKNEPPKSENRFKAPTSVKMFPFKDNKTVFKFPPNKITESVKKLTSPQTPTVLKRSTQKKPLKNVSNLVHKSKKPTEDINQHESAEELAEPLSPEATDETQTPEENELPEDVFIFRPRSLRQTEEANDQDNKGEDNCQRPEQMSKLNTNQHRYSKRLHPCSSREDSPATSETPQQHTGEEAEEIAADGECQEDKDTEDNEPHTIIEPRQVKKEEDDGNGGGSNEIANQTAFQHSRLQLETTRLLELADLWQGTVLKENLPQDVVDEVDSVVGQTRLLTGDKFQQFRRLVADYELQTGARPITLDDLNGFWDMVYLQVEALDKKYRALETLKNNNWVVPEPAGRKKKGRPMKKSLVKKGIETKKPSTSEIQTVHLNHSGDQQMQTVHPGTSSVLRGWKRTRSNSPSPFIAMRLSGVGRTGHGLVQPSMADGTPNRKSTSGGVLDLKVESSSSSPKGSAKKRSKRKQCAIPSVKAELTEEEPIKDGEEAMLPVFTPRRSMRLFAKMATPASCSACTSGIPPFGSSRGERITKRSLVSSSKKKLHFSPSQDQHKSDIAVRTEQSQFEETVTNQPNTSGARFSLRPSILQINDNNNINELPKKGSKRRQLSVFTTSTVTEDGELGTKSRRSTRQSKKVTFDSGEGEKLSLKLPATPYRKVQTDS